ncbi:hypothetical protein G6F22_018619 [Rhizopus arrhizus]|nr:hypothetical protein G6F22_018619 [Rhizopus arrhizus]
MSTWPSSCGSRKRSCPERNGEARAFVAFTVTAGDAVHGQHHDLDAGLFGANHHVAVQTAVFVEVELVDLGATADLAGFLQADRAQRRHAEHRAEFAGRRRNGPLAVVMEQALQGRRRTIYGHRQLLAHHRHGHVHLGHAAQHVVSSSAAPSM